MVHCCLQTQRFRHPKINVLPVQKIGLKLLPGVSNYHHLHLQYNATLLPGVNTVALGMFYGASYTHHTFTPVIEHR